jgi:TetR/AcrR family transcriptional regulator, fatty acid metabolism regulator protein
MDLVFPVYQRFPNRLKKMSNDKKKIAENLTDRQAQIIAESVNIISEQGIQGLTIKNLSKKIGISEPAIYRHFESKIEILLTILDIFNRDKQFALARITEDNLHALKRLEEFYSHHFQAFTENPALTAVIFSEEIFKNDLRLSEKVMGIMKMNQEILSEILENGQRNNELRNDIPKSRLAIIILGSLRLMITQWRLSGFSFNLEKEGGDLWGTIKKLISKS